MKHAGHVWTFKRHPQTSHRSAARPPSTQVNDPVFFFAHAMFDSNLDLWMRRQSASRANDFKSGAENTSMIEIPVWREMFDALQVTCLYVGPLYAAAAVHLPSEPGALTSSYTRNRPHSPLAGATAGGGTIGTPLICSTRRDSGQCSTQVASHTSTSTAALGDLLTRRALNCDEQ